MYSENSLLLEGDQAEIQRFVEQARYVDEDDKDDDEIIAKFSFQKFIPIPAGLSNEWEWCEDNWGIAWDIDVDYDEKQQKYCFNSDENFAPAIRGFLVVSKLFPQIKFTFEYYNCDKDTNFATHGKTEFRDGVVIAEEKGRVRVNRCPDCGRIDGYVK